MGLKRADAYPSRYLGKDDLGGPLRLIIADARMETIKGEHGDEDKAVLLFTDDQKPMILNSTNWDTLEAAYGPDTDGWLGKPVECYVDPGVMFGGRRVGGVRVRIPGGTPLARPTNGQAPSPPRDMLTLEQAVALAESAGMNKGHLVAELKVRGLTGYNPARDTAVAREIIAAWPPVEDLGGRCVRSGDDIPF